jgi:hypothetical protein
MRLPKNRNKNIVVQELENETLIYDFATDKAYCLNETLTVVYNHCDGVTSVDELKRRYKFTDDLIFLALDELQNNKLIEGEKSTHFAGMNRREVIRKVGLGTMLSLPVITGLVAPRAASAASCAANTQNDINNCGSCGNVCNLPNASATCVGGTCQIAACFPGFANCNGSPVDGCETNTTNSATNCGGCGAACQVNNNTPVCINSGCSVGTCNTGFANCSGTAATGCETNITTNTNCGGCGNVCAAGTTCQNGACR